MTGQEHIIAARRHGRAPQVVWLSDTRPVVVGDVQYTAEDKPARADLRFLVGLTVSVSGSDRKTVTAWADACVAAGAGRVLWAVAPVTGSGEFPRCEVQELGDTEGVLSWQA